MATTHSPRQAMVELDQLVRSPREARIFVGEERSPRQAVIDFEKTTRSPREARIRFVTEAFANIFFLGTP